MTAPRRTWSETLVAFDGHIHDPAKDCAHRPGDACRVCCLHDDDPRVTEPEPSDTSSSEWRDDIAGSAKALTWALLGSAVAAALVIVAVLTKAGVIPS